VTNSTTSTTSQAPKSWRDILPIHPACLAYPPLGKVELAELGADIKAHGLELDIVLIREGDKESLLDGRSRLDALEANGIDLVVGCSLDRTLDLGKSNRIRVVADVDPYALVASLNLHRRHLTPEDKRNLITKLLKADPSKSDRHIAKTVKASPTLVGKVRAEKESTGDVSTVDTRRDSKGRRQPARKGWSAERYRRHREKKRHARTKELAVALAGARKTVEILTESEEPGSGPQSSGEVAPLQARIGELEDAVRRRDIEIIGLRSDISELKAACGASERLDDPYEIPAFCRRPMPVNPAEAPTLVAQVEAASEEQRREIEELILKQIPVRRLAKALQRKLKDTDTNSLGVMRKLNPALEADGYSLGNPKNAAATKSAPTAANADETAVTVAPEKITTDTIH
jgi:hypothetical protein